MGRLAAVLSNAERKEETLEGESSIAWPMLVVRAAIRRTVLRRYQLFQRLVALRPGRLLTSLIKRCGLGVEVRDFGCRAGPFHCC